MELWKKNLDCELRLLKIFIQNAKKNDKRSFL